MRFVFETFSKSLPKVRGKLQKESQKRPNGSILEPEGHLFEGFWFLLAPIGSYWLLLAPVGSYWLLLAPISSYWLLFTPMGFYWLLLASIGSYWLLFAPIGSYWLLLVPIGSYWLPLDPICSYWLLLAPIGSYWLKFKRASRSFAKTGFSRFLMDFGTPLGNNFGVILTTSS